MKNLFTTVLAIISSISLLAQERTTVTASTSDISDNLDLRAVATLFGDASDLEDFEQRLNNPKNQISNLDLNNDGYVDYLRVIESVEKNTHLIVVQSVLGKDLFQDVATIEVERDANNRVQVQVVGDVYMYGENYIYEPIYVHTPVIYNTFWVSHYRPYCSAWYWGYYPSYFYYWTPFPTFRYVNHIHMHINFGHTFYYAPYRRCHVAYASYYGRRGNAYENLYPNRSFTSRNNGVRNRYELTNNATSNPRGSSPRTENYGGVKNPRGNNASAENATISEPRSINNPRTESYGGVKNPRGNNASTENATISEPRSTNNPRTENYGGVKNPRNNSYSSSTSSSPRNYSSPKNNTFSSPRSSSSSSMGASTPRGSSSRNGDGNIGRGGSRR